MTEPAHRLRRAIALMRRAETYRARLEGAEGTAYAVAETLYCAALSEMFEEMRTLRDDGTLDILESFLETWRTRH